jgi:alpha-L-fucosidase
MKKHMILYLSLSIIAICSIILCDTAFGPTPYESYTGEITFSSQMKIEKGLKTLNVRGSLPIIVSTSDTSNNVAIIPDSAKTFTMKGNLKSYDRKNGTMIVDVKDIIGSGTFKDWKLVLCTDSLAIAKKAYVDLKFGMFLHFNMSTFDRYDCDKCYSVAGEWGLASRDPKIFNPTALDCGQWARVAKSAGCKYMVLTTKHHDGFCNWPSKYTEYCVRNATIKTDICKAFVDSARAYGMKIGFYYSIRDLTNGYELDFIRGQLTELLTNYGEVICLWFDGWGWGPGYKAVPYDSVRAIIKSIQPYCLIVENNHEFNTTHSEMIEYEMPIDGPPPSNNVLPAEGNEPIRLRTPQFEPLWFWHPKGNCEIMSAQSIVRQLEENNSRNAAYLLDLTPDTLGLIPQCQADVMKEVGELRKAKNK